jgi:hypothetical protein
MSEANDQPADAGVGGQGKDAPTDDIDTAAFDREEALDDDPEPDAPKAEGEGDDDPDKAKTAPEDDDLVEVEYEGQKIRVSAAAKDALLRQADYTRKTSEVAETRRQLDEERKSWESQREQSRAVLPEEHAQVAVLSHELGAVDKQLEQFKAIDWETWRAQVQNVADDDPNKLRYVRYRDAFLAARDSRIDLNDRLDAAKSDLQTKEATRLSEQQTANAADLAKRREETGKALAAQVPGWNKDTATAVATFMHTDLGLTREEIGEATDPRLWRLVHEVITSRSTIATLKTTQKQQQTADKHAKDQTTTPAVTTKGTGASVRDPTTPRGDGLSTAEWMRRRNAQLAKRRA